MSKLSLLVFARRPLQTLTATAFLFVATQTIAAEKVIIDYRAGSYEQTKEELNKLQILITELKSKTNASVVIKVPTLNVKSSSLPYILAKNRALSVFRELVEQGINPAAIQNEEIAADTKNATQVFLEVRDESAAAVQNKIVPRENSAAGETTFTLNFPSASADPVDLDDNAFMEFLSSVGAPGRDAVVIEGFTDTVGNAQYNKALGNFRALRTYEKMIRLGLPIYRVETKSHGASKAANKGDSAVDRKVVVHWVQNKQIAATAAKEDSVVPTTPAAESQKPVDPVPEVPAAENAVAAPVAENAAASREGELFDLVPFAGILTPGGDLKSNAKSGAIYGLGIGKAFWIEPQGEARINLFASAKSKLKAKESDRNGDLDISLINLRLDYAYGQGPVRPFLGVGYGIYKWDGAITQPSTQLRNLGSRSDSGFNLTVGLEFFLRPNLFLAPEFAYSWIGGDFGEPLMSGTASLRWRL